MITLRNVVLPAVAHGVMSDSEDDDEDGVKSPWTPIIRSHIPPIKVFEIKSNGLTFPSTNGIRLEGKNSKMKERLSE